MSIVVREVVVDQPTAICTLGTWQCCAASPGSITHPKQLESATDWISATVPGTVASALAAAGRWSFDQAPEIDASDWWFRTTFPAAHATFPTILHLDGLATLAEIWLNGELLLSTNNMFRRYRIDATSKLREDNELAIGFRSLTDDIKRKRPRPRWKTNLVNNQQLRWHRTSLLGRIPGWSPPGPSIGPWQAIRLESSRVTRNEFRLNTRLDGADGIVDVFAELTSDRFVTKAALTVAGIRYPLTVQEDIASLAVFGQVRIPNVEAWWPQTHGHPALYDCHLHIEAGGQEYQFDCAKIGFRTIEAVRDSGFQIRVNGEQVFCRGACWTVGNILTLNADEFTLRSDLTLARDAGVNMLRVGGTMVYESELFYRLCDELGILVWQDFMFANMDYPVDDESFLQNVEAEATEQLVRLAAHPCVAVYCGNSEVEQQAAMLGMPRNIWSNRWFAERLPSLCAKLHPGSIYVSSTPTSGILPFQPEHGLTHYYGVGAYLRPVTDVRRSNVKFTPETLGFSNIPEPATVDAIMGGAAPLMHDPRWKRRVPRDTGAGWDFEDVRDHYLKELFDVDPIRLRSSDPSRYLQLSRIVPGEIMRQVFSEWRSAHSQNGGALVWFYKDLWPAAGWGILDSTGTPKAAYYDLKRVWSSRQLVITDEGLNGLHLHLTNETQDSVSGSLEVTLWKEPNIVVARQRVETTLIPRSQQMFSADQILGGFYDVSYAYRFGPPHHDFVVATWFDSEGTVISEGFHFIQRTQPIRMPSAKIETNVERTGDDEFRVTIHSDKVLRGVQLTAKGFLPDDNYFHLPPERMKSVTFRSRSSTLPQFKVSIESLNLETTQVVAYRAT